MKKTTILIVSCVIVFLAAMSLTVYPLVSTYVNDRFASEIHTAYEEVVSEAEDDTLATAMAAAQDYNAAFDLELQAYSQEALTAAQQGYNELLDLTGTGVMGYVSIPKISVNLPIYHGTGADSLDRGIGHLLGSSLPVGGESTHSVLSAHSGMANQKMFTDLEQLTEGDVFYITVLGETLAYQVDSINVVLPYDTTLLGITEGEDYCTLITCTPYGVNTHRLLVRGTRIAYEEAEEVQIRQAQEEPEVKSSWEQHYIQGVIWGCAIAAVLVVLLIAAVVIVLQYRKKHPKEAAPLEEK